MWELLKKFITNPVIMFGILFSLFGVAFILPPYSLLGNIWVTAIGVGVLAATNMVGLSELKNNFAKNKKSILKLINDVDADHQDDVITTIKSHLAAKQAAATDTAKIAKYLKMQEAFKGINSMEDIALCLAQCEELINRLEKVHNVSTAIFTVSFLLASIIQTYSAVMDTSGHADTDTLEYFPYYPLKGVAYLGLAGAHMAHMVRFALFNDRAATFKKVLEKEKDVLSMRQSV